MEKNKTVTGSCHCGKITFSALIYPDRTYVCHCKDCQKQAGGAYSVIVKATKLEATGNPTFYWRTTHLNNTRELAFCSTCGTHLWGTDIPDRRMYGVRLGVIDQKEELTPKYQIWCSSAIPWAFLRDETNTMNFTENP